MSDSRVETDGAEGGERGSEGHTVLTKGWRLGSNVNKDLVHNRCRLLSDLKG